MKDWMKFFETLAGKLTAILAFAVLLIVVLALWGGQIPAEYRPLVYIVAILAMVIFTVQVVLYRRPVKGDGKPASKAISIGEMKESVQIVGNRNQVTYIINNYAKSHNGVDREDLQRQVDEYLDWMQESYGAITLRGIEKGGSQVVTLPLESVYVPLLAERQLDFRAEEFDVEKGDWSSRIGHEERSGEAREIRLDEVLSLGKRLIITGGPGCGKTTVLQHIAWTLAASLQGKETLARQRLGLKGETPLPVYVPLSLYAAHLRNLKPGAPAEQKSLAYFISEYLIQRQTNLTLPPTFLAHLLRNETSILLLLDGLDEVPTEDERERVVQAIQDLTAGRTNLRVVVTSRTAAYRGRAVLGRGFQHIRVLPLQKEHIEAIVRRAYSAIHPQSQQKAKSQADSLLDEIERLEEERRRRLGEDVEPFVTSPLMVRMLLIVHVNDKHLPDQRADLYKKAVDAMLRPDYIEDKDVVKELERRISGSLAMNRDMLQLLAFRMHSRGEKQGRQLDEKSIREILEAEETYAPYVNELLAQTRERGTLLEERGGLYRFLHLSFQEFLTGRYLAQVLHSPDRIAAFLEDGLVLDSWWREPVLLMFGYLDVDSPNMLPKVLARLAGMDDQAQTRQKPAFDIQLACAELAAAAFLECKNQYAGLGDRLSRRLQELHQESQKERWRPILLASAMDALDRLGYTPPDLYTFVPVERDGISFYIGKYPVTNAQYARFLKKENFENKALWSDFPKYSEPDEKGESHKMGNWGRAGWDWLQRVLKDKENLVEGGVLYPRFWRDPRFGAARRTAPLVGISWWEANAYCKWLLEHWEELEEGQQPGVVKPKEVRLPTEHEWVAAAGGEEEDRFAFGVLKNPEQEIARFANTHESNIGRTTPVWMYPQGASPCGIMDMSGNVWEWQANYRDTDRDVVSLRGGSWLNLQVGARVSYRYDYPPYDWLDFIGFRVVSLRSEA